MVPYRVVFPNQHSFQLPAATVAAIEQAKANYSEPLWWYREERLLKVGAHQWVTPAGPAAAQALCAQHPGILALFWKLFNRSWLAAAESYWLDRERYPAHPRHLGEGVLPLVDEDRGLQQIGWVRILQQTTMDANYAVFVQCVLLDCFEPRPLPAAYGQL
jgi:hypothetical protein